MFSFFFVDLMIFGCFSIEEGPSSLHWCGWRLFRNRAVGTCFGRHSRCASCRCHGCGGFLNDGEPQQWLLPTRRRLVCVVCGEGGGYQHQTSIYLCPLPLCYRSGFVADLLQEHHLSGTSTLAFLFQTCARKRADDPALRDAMRGRDGPMSISGTGYL